MPRYQYRYRRPQRRRIRIRWFLLALAVAALVAYPFVEPSMLQIEEHTLYVTNLPSNLKNIRIVFASDIHQGPWFSQKQVDEVFSTINGLSADLVILGGDYAVDSDGAVQFFKTAPNLYARLGVYAVVGNHDRTMPESNLTTLKNAMLSAGVTPLVNAVQRVRIGTSDIVLAGIDDINNGYPDLAGVAKQVSVDDYVIFLCHSPGIIPDAIRAVDSTGRGSWFDLGLFGHTHGGQIAFLESIVDTNGVPARYESGWLRENRIDMLVSHGVGTSNLPVRFLCRPQIHVITIKPDT